MKLPNSALAVVEDEKVITYLLNAEHRYGASKARFFASFGFHAGNWEVFAAALRAHGQRHDVESVKATPFGPRYLIIGNLDAPDGRTPRICTVWQIDEGEIAPRLITAYPFKA